MSEEKQKAGEGKFKRLVKKVFPKSKIQPFSEEGKWSKHTPSVGLASQSLQSHHVSQLQQTTQQKTKLSSFQKFRNKLARNTWNITLLFGGLGIATAAIAGIISSPTSSPLLVSVFQTLFLSFMIPAIIGYFVTVDNCSILSDAASKGDTEKCKKCIENGAVVDWAQTNLRMTPLMDATKNKHKETVEYLLSMGANPFKKYKFKGTARDLTEDPEIKRILKLYERAWTLNKHIGPQILSSVKDCSPPEVKEIFENL